MSDYMPYIRLRPEIDLDLNTVESKLETLAGSVPDRFRYQVDRCFSNAFTDVFCIKANSEDEPRAQYFTEHQLAVAFHKLAYRIFIPLVAYAGHLGQLVKDNAAYEIIPEVTSAAKRVFKYAEETKPLPRLDRSDLQEFNVYRDQMKKLILKHNEMN
jgi:hypothetical protein